MNLILKKKDYLKFLRYILILVLILNAQVSFGQKTNLPDSLRQIVWAARLHSGFIFAHSVHVQNTKGTKPNGFELEYSHLRTDSTTQAKFKCYSRSGFSFTFVDFNKRLLGKSYSACYFLEPNYRLSDKLKMSIRASAGFSYLTNPFDSIKNPANQSYSGHINNFLQLGLGFSYPVSKQLDVYTMANFFHNSNGGFKEPNGGVNYINASIGLQYYKYSGALPAYKKVRDTSWKKDPLHVDVSIYYSPKSGFHYTDDTIKPQHKFVAGAAIQIIKRVGNIDAITAAAEIYYDDALRSIKDIYVKDNSSATLAGLLVGHQFLLNRFTFSQQLGVYVFKQTKTYNTDYQDLFHTIYHRWGISYTINRQFSAGIYLLAHNQIADFIDARINYRIK